MFSKVGVYKMENKKQTWTPEKEKEKAKEILDNDGLNGSYIINKDGTIDTKGSKENETPEIPSVSYFTLFRFATKQDKWFIFIAMMASVISGCMTPLSTLLFASLLQSMVNYGMSLLIGDPQDEIFLAAVRDFAIYNCIYGVVLVIGGYLATVLMNISAFNQVYRIRQEYLKSAMNQDFEYFDLRQTSDFATKMSDDVIKLEDGIGEKAATFVYYQSIFISSVIMALVRGWKLALLCLITFPVTLFLVGLSGLIASRLTKQEVVASGKAGAVAEEVFSSIRTVYAFSGQHKETERYQTYLDQARAINVKKGFFNGLSMGLLFFCIFCAYALSFWFGARLMISEPDHYNAEVMIAVFFGVLMGSANFGIAFTLVEAFGMAKGAGAHIFYLIDNVPTINPLLNRGVTPNSVDGDLEFKNVKFQYPSRPDVPVLKGVNLTVKNGQTVALVGPSGSGKSTIIQLISRYYDVADGSVCLDGRDVRDLSVRWLRAQIGLVGQEPVLFNATIGENIRYGRESATQQEIEACARAANAHQFITMLPKGYDTQVGERGTALSGGQKQRIAIARALVRDPRVLLLDEATSALDTASEYKVQAALDKAREGRTTIVVAHRLSTIRNVDLIYVFKNGTIVESGNHDVLMAKKGVYYDMVTLQDLPELEDSKDSKLTREISVISDQLKEEEKPEILEDAEDEAPSVPFWGVLKLNSPEWKSITVASICSLASGFAMPMLAVVFGDFIGALSSDDEEYIMDQTRIYALMFVGIGILSGLTNFIQVFLYGIAGEHLTQRLRRLMFQGLLQQELGFYDDKNNATGSLCAKLSGEASYVQGATGQRIGTVVQAVGTFGFALVLALIYEWRVGLVALSFVPIIVGIMYKQGRMVSEESFGAAKTMQSSAKVAVEAVSNIRTVASLGREPLFLQEYEQQLRPALALAKRASHWRGVVFGLSRGLFNFVYAAALFYGGQIIVYEGVPYDLVLKAAQALLMGSSTAASAFAFAPNFQKGINAAGRIIVLLNRQPKIVDPNKPAIEDFNGTGEASLQSVRFRYPTRPTVEVLKGLDLEIQKGKTIALVGSSGCGKSTVIQLLERYYDPDAGMVALDTIPLPQLRMNELRRGLGLVQQEPVLFDRSIGDNIAYGDNSRVPSMSEIIDAAKKANIHNFVTSLPMGYDTNIGTKGTQLSGGQKQRVAIARALLRQPQILLLDEATSALDTESEKVVQDALDTAREGRTCITIAHRLSTIKDADVICVIHAGRVAEKGTHQELMAAKGLYYTLNKRGQA